MNVLAVIPARGGSSRLPDKNVRPCAGKPLLAWSIEAALNAQHVTRVVVSTDSDRYAEIARAHGAETCGQPGAGHASRIEGALRHALDVFGPADLVVTLQPTCPIREPGLVDRCVDYLARRPWLRSVFTGYWAGIVHGSRPDWKVGGHPPWRVWTSQFGERRIPQSQAWTEDDMHFAEDGSVFVTRAAALLEQDERRARPYWLITAPRTVDIDGEEDFRLAEMMLRARVREEVAS